MDLRLKQRKIAIPKLREASRFWSEKTVARNRAKVKLEIGKYKNGKPRYEIKYRCASCRKLVDKSDGQMDHINPVIDPVIGFTDWNNYVDRLLCSADGYQHLCTKCHEKKTIEENKIRKQNRKPTKKKKRIKKA